MKPQHQLVYFSDHGRITGWQKVKEVDMGQPYAVQVNWLFLEVTLNQSPEMYSTKNNFRD